MKITICDDTLSDLKNLENLLNSYANTNNISITLEKYTNPDDLLNKVSFNPTNYRLFFLDIVMQKSGIDLAAKIRKYMRYL